MCYFVYMTYAGGGDPTPTSSFMLAIVDTACTKSVAGYRWFEEYYTLADKAGIPVKIVDLTDTFKFGASKVFESNFAVWAWFAIDGKWFAVRVSNVQCDVPLLFFRSVLAGLGMQLDVAGHKAILTALQDCENGLATSETGHPALKVSQFPNSKPPFLAFKAADEVCVPNSGCEGYMEHSVVETPKTLFCPKKISKVVQNLLMEKGTISGTSFFTWWRAVNQSRDFWIETDSEINRIHICPRRDQFDPSKWNTTLIELKKTLLQSITGHRVTEMIPCLNEGIQVETSQDNLSDNHIVKWQHGPWIGRSRFAKSSVARYPTTAHLTNAQGSIAMEHAQGGAAGGVAPPGPSSTRELVSPRVEGDLGGALQAGERHRTHRDIEPTETRGLAKMNLEQLVQECNKLEITMATKPTRGALMLLIRDHTKSPVHTVMPFGRYKGWHYCEVPKGYKTWAVEEVSKNSHASEDLVRFAKWSKEDLIKNEPSPIPTHNLARDPEALAMVPPPSMEELESDSSAWSRVSHRPSRKGRRDTDMEEEHLVTDPKAEMVRLERRLEELKRAEKEKNMR